MHEYHEGEQLRADSNASRDRRRGFIKLGISSNAISVPPWVAARLELIQLECANWDMVVAKKQKAIAYFVQIC